MYRFIQNLPFDTNALHDIRLRFNVEGIWLVVSTNSSLKLNPVSKDIRLDVQKINDLEIIVTIHHTDIITIIIGCSYTPVAVDVNGVIRLSSALAIIEKRLSRLLDVYGQTIGYSKKLVIPDHMSWIVTMWHFGADASVTYTREKFFASWKVGHNALIAV
jgi:hypothetical protein